MDEVQDEAAAENAAAAWESKLEHLISYIEPFEEYINGQMPKELHPAATPFALSYSSISKLADNPLRFYEYVVNSKFLGRKEPTKAMLIGLIADDYILSRLVAGEEQAYVPMLNSHKRNTKAGKASYAEEVATLTTAHPNAIIIDKDTYEKAQNVVNSLVGTYTYNNQIHYVRKQAYDLLITNAVGSKKRFTYICPLFGLKVVGEIDLFGKDENGDWYAADLKSMASVDNKTFYYSVRDRLLYLQAYIYKLALKQVFNIEIKNYYVVAGCADGHSNIYKLNQRDFEKGRQDYEAGLSTFAECLMLGAPAFIQSYDIKKYEF
jgi:hypothetical protein